MLVHVPRRVALLGCALALASFAPLASTSSASAANCTAGSWARYDLDEGDRTTWKVRYETTHFVFRSKDADNVGLDPMQAGGVRLERAWDTYMGKVGWPEPYCNSAQKRKVNVFMAPGYGLSGSGRAEGDMSMWVDPGAGWNDFGLAHEFAHGLQFNSGGNRDSPYSGWFWENHANFMAHQVPGNQDTAHCTGLRVKNSWIYWGSTRDRYCSFSFLQYLVNHHGQGIVRDAWFKAPTGNARTTADPILTLRDAAGWSQDRFNDEIARWSMASVVSDMREPDGFDWGSTLFKTHGDPDTMPDGSYAQRRTRLAAIDDSSSRYTVPLDFAPQRYGANQVELFPAAGATSITVKFRGIVQSTRPSNDVGTLPGEPSNLPAPSSGWRWGVVIRQNDGGYRYSALQSATSGDLTVPVRDSDKSVWLVVTGAPTEHHKIVWDQPYRTLYRYPWQVQLVGAKPEGYQPNAPTPTAKGHRHANGGGWVADGANVDASAYVGPHAIVYGGNVLGNARIEGFAIVNNGTVRDNAVVAGISNLSKNWTVKDNARIETSLTAEGRWGVTVGGNATIWGDAEMTCETVDHGSWTGMIGGCDSTTGYGARTGRLPEVTAPLPSGWIGGGAPSVGRAGTLVGVASSRCLNVPYNETKIGLQTELWDCHGGANQRWTYTAAGELRTAGNTCLDVMGAVKTNGGQVAAWPCHGGANQKWTFRDNGTLTTNDSGLCLDASGWGTANGTKIQTWACHGGTNQRWTFK